MLVTSDAAAVARDLAKVLVTEYEVSGADAAKVMGMSPQRFSQLVNS